MKELLKTYRIETSRFVIRPYRIEDAPLLQTAITESLVHLKPYMKWAWEEPETSIEKENRIRTMRGNYDLGSDYTMGIFNKFETKLIGSTGFHNRVGSGALEVGYWTHVDFIRQGICTEVVKALCDVAFRIEPVEYLVIKCEPNNKGSARVAESCGFTLREILKETATDVFGKTCDMMHWELTREEFLKQPSASTSVAAFDLAGRHLTERKN